MMARVFCFCRKLSLVGVPQDFRVLPGVCLDGVEDVDVVLLVHSDHVSLHHIFILVVNLEPVRAGFGQHGDRADTDRGSDDGRLIDAVMFREFVRELVDDRIRNTDVVAFCGLNVDCLTMVAKGQNGIDLFALGIWHLDVTERCFFRGAERAKESGYQKERKKRSGHSL